MEPRRFPVDRRKLRWLVAGPTGFALVLAAVAGVRVLALRDASALGVLLGATVAATVTAVAGTVAWRVLSSHVIVLTEDTIRSSGGGRPEVTLSREAVEAIARYPKGKVWIRGRQGRPSIPVPAYLADRDALLAAVSAWAPLERRWIEPGTGPLFAGLAAVVAFLALRGHPLSVRLGGAVAVLAGAVLLARLRRR